MESIEPQRIINRNQAGTKATEEILLLARRRRAAPLQIPSFRTSSLQYLRYVMSHSCEPSRMILRWLAIFCRAIASIFASSVSSISSAVRASCRIALRSSRNPTWSISAKNLPTEIQQRLARLMLVPAVPVRGCVLHAGGLCQDVMVLNCPLRIAGCVLDLLVAEGGIAHTQHAKLGRHAIEIQADAVEIRVGGAMGER
jgi:hypothetical protein